MPILQMKKLRGNHLLKFQRSGLFTASLTTFFWLSGILTVTLVLQRPQLPSLLGQFSIPASSNILSMWGEMTLSLKSQL